MDPRYLWKNMTVLIAIAFLTTVESTTIQDCPDVQASIDSTKTIDFKCDGPPTYTVNPATPTWGTATYASNQWLFSMTSNLVLDIGGKCPAELTNVDCSQAMLTLGTAFGREDALNVQLDSKYFFGTLNWYCSIPDETRGVNYIFPVITTGNDADSDIDAEGAAFLKAVLDANNGAAGFSTDIDKLDITKLLKFDKVSDSTVIYYSQGDGIGIQFVFASEDASIKLSEAQYDVIFPTDGVSKEDEVIPANAVCDKVYQLIFSSAKQVSAQNGIIFFTLLLFTRSVHASKH